MRCRGRWRFRLWAAALLLTGSEGHAAPRIPAADDVVLERVPALAEVKTLEPLRYRVAQNPDDLSSALALSQGYLTIGRTTADPRFVSYAQATLVPWLTADRANAAILTLQATTLQYLHQFDAALILLERATTLEPLNAQAWLTKASILQVQGRFDAARAGCRPLIRTAPALIALTCLTGVNSMTGKLQASYASLRSVYRDGRQLGIGLRLWILTALADMATRLGDVEAAEEALRAALAADPRDPTTLCAYADLLLSQHRDTEVINLLRSGEQQDNLLLRLAIAGTHLHSSEAGRWSDTYRARYQAARQDGDFTHLREQARFLLEVRGEAREALEMARRNWQVQREPADVHVYMKAAAATGDLRQAQSVIAWIRQTHYEDASLEAAVHP